VGTVNLDTCVADVKYEYAMVVIHG
jgi:hypothetical protein